MFSEEEILPLLSKKQQGSLDFFIYGYITFIISYTLGSTNNSYISPAACQGIQIIGVALLSYGGAGILKFKFDNKFLQLI